MKAEGLRTKSAVPALLVGLILIGSTGWFLSRMKGMQRLGNPGVKVVRADLRGETGDVVATNAVPLPLNVSGYHATNLPITRTELDWLPKDTTYGRVGYIADDGFRMVMSAVLMGSDRTSIHKPEYCLVGQGFKIDSQSAVRIPVMSPVPYELPVMKMVTTRETKLPDGSVVRTRGLYVFWFVADGRLSADHNQRMLSMAWDLVTTGVLQRWAYIACLAECEVGQEDALFARMSGLIAAAVPHFQLATGKPVQTAAIAQSDRAVAP